MSVHRITKLKDIAQCLAHTRNLINVSLAFLYPWSLQRPVNIQLVILGHAITKQFRWSSDLHLNMKDFLFVLHGNFLSSLCLSMEIFYFKGRSWRGQFLAKEMVVREASLPVLGPKSQAASLPAWTRRGYLWHHQVYLVQLWAPSVPLVLWPKATQRWLSSGHPLWSVSVLLQLQGSIDDPRANLSPWQRGLLQNHWFAGVFQCLNIYDRALLEEEFLYREKKKKQGKEVGRNLVL